MIRDLCNIFKRVNFIKSLLTYGKKSTASIKKVEEWHKCRFFKIWQRNCHYVVFSITSATIGSMTIATRKFGKNHSQLGTMSQNHHSMCADFISTFTNESHICKSSSFLKEKKKTFNSKISNFSRRKSAKNKIREISNT